MSAASLENRRIALASAIATHAGQPAYVVLKAAGEYEAYLDSASSSAEPTEVVIRLKLDASDLHSSAAAALAPGGAISVALSQLEEALK